VSIPPFPASEPFPLAAPCVLPLKRTEAGRLLSTYARSSLRAGHVLDGFLLVFFVLYPCRMMGPVMKGSLPPPILVLARNQGGGTWFLPTSQNKIGQLGHWALGC
jgi:hypothetical protein